MAWSIGLLGNNVKISQKCAKDLFKVGQDEIWFDLEQVTEHDVLYFNPDHMEHMDFLNNPEVLKVLLKNKVNGDITFGSLEGDNNGSFWGYRFEDGVLTRLKGEVVFKLK